MNNCPPELHSYIFELACTDDGSTSRSLALVSKYFRDVAKPFQYQSIALAGPAQIVNLLTHLEKTPPHRRRIRHLFLSDHSYHECDLAPLVTPFDSAKILRLVTLAAPTLETLSLFAASPSTSTSILAGIFHTYFPRLIELSVAGFYPFPQTAGNLPRLERLHLRGNRNPYGLLQAGALDVACPALTHLRVSGLSMAISFVNEVEEALGDGGHVVPDLFPAKMPNNLRVLLLQAAPTPVFVGRSTLARKKEETMVERLRGLERTEPGHSGVQVALLERSSTQSTYDAAKREWIDRLHGGRGCWALSPKD
jgi:hypothetical protein